MPFSLPGLIIIVIIVNFIIVIIVNFMIVIIVNKLSAKDPRYLEISLPFESEHDFQYVSSRFRPVPGRILACQLLRKMTGFWPSVWYYPRGGGF